MIRIIYNTILISYFCFLAIIFSILSAIAFVLLYPFDKKRVVIHYLSAIWTYYCFILLNPFWKKILTGKELIDKNKSYIIVSNHQSLLDITMMYYVPLIFKWISKIEVLKTPIIGQMLYLHGDIMVKRGDSNSAKKMMIDATKWIQRGCSIAVFPEGTRTTDGQVKEFKEGAFLLAKKTKTAILPIVLDGSYSVLPKKSMPAKIRHTFHLKVLPEISAEEVAATSIKEMTKRVENLITEEHKKIAPQFYTD